MRIIDTHCHASPSWFEPVEVLLYQMERNGVDHSLLIQHGGMFDNDYLLSCAEEHPDRVSPVVLIDLEEETPVETLEDLADRGACGIRIILQFPASEQFPAVLERVNELGLPISVFGTPDLYGSEKFEQIVDVCSDVPVVIEHLGGINKADPPYDQFEETFGPALGYADRSNVYVKVPGLGEIYPRPSRLDQSYPFENTEPYLEMFTEAYGVERMMWGSDFPPCAFREGYRNTLDGIRDHTSFTDDELEWIFGKTAAEVWDIPVSAD